MILPPHSTWSLAVPLACGGAAALFLLVLLGCYLRCRAEKPKHLRRDRLSQVFITVPRTAYIQFAKNVRVKDSPLRIQPMRDIKRPPMPLNSIKGGNASAGRTAVRVAPLSPQPQTRSRPVSPRPLAPPTEGHDASYQDNNSSTA